MQGISNKITTFENNIKEWIAGIPQALSDAFRGLFGDLFLPDEENLYARSESIKNKFDFVTSIQEESTGIIDFLQTASGATAPTITVSFAGKGGTSWGNGSFTINFDWYLPYKPTVDAIIAGVVWAKFLWSLYLSIPSIIQGNAAGAVAVFKTDAELTRRGNDDN